MKPTWYQFKDKKPEIDQLCIVEGTEGLPTVFVFTSSTEEDEIVFEEWCDDYDSWGCDPEDWWTPYPFPRLSETKK